ncbi:hypothetical protein [Rheinheimera faecalis]
MIVREYIECETCSEKHTLRIQVGYSNYQEHTFSCVKCAENIVIGMHCDQVQGDIAIELKENAIQGTKGGHVLYLSSEFPVQKDMINQEDSFPAFTHMKALFNKLIESGVDLESNEQYDKFAMQAALTANEEDNWKFIKKGWSLTNKGRQYLALENLQKYKSFGFDGPYELNHVLFDFSSKIIQPKKYKLFELAAHTLTLIREINQSEYYRFVQYYKKSLQNEHLDRYFDVFSEYFSCHDDFRQTAISIRAEIELPKDYIASSSNFNKTKLFYGNAFEALTSNLTVLACLNNIRQGRRFDEFANMDLKKYLTINKANRSNPFNDFPEFSSISACLDSTLRNASHHGAMRIDGTTRKITYRSGGTGALQEMSYREYLDKCNLIFVSCCALLKLEILIAY